MTNDEILELVEKQRLDLLQLGESMSKAASALAVLSDSLKDGGESYLRAALSTAELMTALYERMGR